MSYIFDTSKGETPETLKRKRELADMLLGRRRGIASNVGEGLAELGNAIAYRMAAGKADRAAAFGQEQAQKGFAPILAALGGGGVAAAPAPSVAATGAAPAPSGGNADAIRQGLIQRGLAPHVADGFVRNFQDESRLDPTINERSPIVPGSRGGFGLAQWTGPRRRALEQYAASKGVAPGDMDMQLDFLMSELQGPESRAAKAIMAAPDSNSAAVAVLNNFLRPAESHRAKREARYMGQTAAQTPVQAASPVPAPQQSQQASATVAPSQGGGIGLPQLLQAAQNPWVAQNPLYSGIINTLIENQLQLGKPLDPMTKLQMEKLALEIEQTRNPRMSPADAANTGLARDRFEFDKGQAGLTPDIKEYNVYAEQMRARGQEPVDIMTYQQMLRKSGADNTNLNVNSGEAPDGELRKTLDKKTGEVWSAFDEAGANSSAMAQDMQVLNELIKIAPQGPLQGRLAELFPGFSSAGDAFQSIVKRVAPTLRAPGSGATSDIEYDGMLRSLPALRNNPEANAAIAQVMTEKAKINIERADIIRRYRTGELSRSQADSAIAEIGKRSIMTPEMKRALNALGGQQDKTGVPEGIDPQVWEFMTPEEKALWQN